MDLIISAISSTANRPYLGDKGTLGQCAMRSVHVVLVWFGYSYAVQSAKLRTLTLENKEIYLLL